MTQSTLVINANDQLYAFCTGKVYLRKKNISKEGGVLLLNPPWCPEL